MSRTTRRYLGGIGRDGHQDWRTSIARDNRATGLRTHKRDRRVARASLKSGNGDSLPGGKRRRYSDRYGAYELVATAVFCRGVSVRMWGNVNSNRYVTIE